MNNQRGLVINEEKPELLEGLLDETKDGVKKKKKSVKGRLKKAGNAAAQSAQNVAGKLNETVVQPTKIKVIEVTNGAQRRAEEATGTILKGTSRLFKENVRDPIANVSLQVNATVSEFKDTVESVGNNLVFAALMISKMNNLKNQYETDMKELYRLRAETCFPFFIDFEIETKRQKREALNALLDTRSLEDLSSLASYYMSDIRVSWSLKTNNMMDLLQEIKDGCDERLASTNEESVRFCC